MKLHSRQEPQDNIFHRTFNTMAVSDFQRAVQLIERRQYPEAIATLQQLTRLAPIHVVAHVLLAEAYEANGQQKEALQVWRQAYALLSSSPKIRAGIERTSGMALPQAHIPQPRATPRTEFVVEKAPPLGHRQTPPSLSAGLDENDGFWDLRTAQDLEASLDIPPTTGEPEPDTSWTEIGNFKPTVQRLEAEFEAAATQRITSFAPDIKDLDTLIQQLDSAGPIRPDPFDPNMPEEDYAPLTDEEEPVEIVSETFAQIHVSQKRYLEASRIYERLAQQHPELADTYNAKAAELREMVRMQGGG